MMQIPKEWCEVLQKVKSVMPNAVIAGGCLRDLDYGKDIKDVDIFIPKSDFDRENIAVSFAELMDLDVDDDAFDELYDIPDNADRVIIAVFKDYVDGFNYDYIVTTDAGVNPDTFDFSICQVSFDGSKIYRSPAYIKTKETGVITQENPRPPERMEERVLRLKSKFPELDIKYD